MTQLTPDQRRDKSNTPNPGSDAPELQRQFVAETKRREETLAKIKTDDLPAKDFVWASIVLVVFGVAFVVAGWKEWGLASAASSVPEEISLKDLIARGPDGNPNVLLTNFVLGDRVVYQQKKGEKTWEKALVPVFPMGSGPPGLDRVSRAGLIRAVLVSTNATSEADFSRRGQQPKLHALVSNRIKSLDAKELKLLKDFYEVDFSHCLIIEEGQEPPGFLKIALMVGGGVVGTALGLRLLGRGIYRRIHNQPPAELHKVTPPEAST